MKFLMILMYFPLAVFSNTFTQKLYNSSNKEIGEIRYSYSEDGFGIHLPSESITNLSADDFIDDSFLMNKLAYKGQDFLTKKDTEKDQEILFRIRFAALKDKRILRSSKVRQILTDYNSTSSDAKGTRGFRDWDCHYRNALEIIDPTKKPRPVVFVFDGLKGYRPLSYLHDKYDAREMADYHLVDDPYNSLYQSLSSNRITDKLSEHTNWFYYPEDDNNIFGSDTAFNCAQKMVGQEFLMDDGKKKSVVSPKVMVVGYSNGGHAASLHTRKLKKINKDVHQLIMVDPVPSASFGSGNKKFKRPDGALWVVNFYQRSDKGSIAGIKKIYGSQVKDADEEYLMKGSTHTSIIYNHKVVNKIMSSLNQLL